MSDTPEKTTEEQKPRKRNTEAKAAAVVGTVAVLAVLVVIGMNAGWLTASPRENDNGSVEQPPPVDAVPPEIVSLTSSAAQVSPAGTAALKCEVEHPSPGDLIYTWSPMGGVIHGEGSEVQWIAPDNEGLFRIVLTVDDGLGNTDEGSLTVRVRVNRPPEILAMESRIAADSWILPGASVVVWCKADDPDGDALTYRWAATEGELFGQGDSVVWVAPDAVGTYWVTVFVSDPHGEESRRAIPITVSEARPPEIDGFLLRPVGHSMLMAHGDGWRVFIERPCTIEAFVDDDALEYTYEWSADRGTLTPDGPNAVWQPPPTKGDVTIVLKVSDAHGNTASASVYVYVTDCALCFG